MSNQRTITTVEQLNKIRIVFCPKQAQKKAQSGSGLAKYEVQFFEMGEKTDMMIHPVFRITECNMQGPFLPFLNRVKSYDVGPIVPVVKAVLPVNSPQYKFVSELERRINTAAAIYAYSLKDIREPSERSEFIDIGYDIVTAAKKEVKIAYAIDRNRTKVPIVDEMVTINPTLKAFDYLKSVFTLGYSYEDLFFPKENLFYGEGEDRRYYKEFRIGTQFNETRESRKRDHQPTPEMQTVKYWGFDILKSNGKNGDDFALIGNDDLCTKTTPITTPKGQNNFTGGIAFTVSGIVAPVNGSKLNIYMYGTAFYSDIQNSSPKRYLGMNVVNDVKPIEGQTISLAALKASSPTAASAVDKQIEGSEAEE